MSTKVTDKKGLTADAYNLIMKKEFAYQILKGIKKIEFRNVTPFYTKMFFEVGKQFVPKGMQYVHFHDYNNTWFLDIKIAGVYTETLTADDLWFFDMWSETSVEADIEEAIKNNITKSDLKDCKIAYCLPIDGIINTNLDVSSLKVEFCNIADFKK